MKHGLPDSVCHLRGGGGHLYRSGLQILRPAADPVFYSSQLCRKGKIDKRVTLRAIPVVNAEWHCYDTVDCNAETISFFLFL